MTRQTGIANLTSEEKLQIGKKLKALREEKNWTQQYLSDQMREISDLSSSRDFSPRSISRAENVGNASIRFLRFMAKALDVTLDELCEEAGFEHSDLQMHEKLIRFHHILCTGFKPYIKRAPSTPEDVKTRQQIVTMRVETLSIEIFGEKTPPAVGPILPNVEYPEMECKFCWDSIKPKESSESRCPRCQLPLCYWVGIVRRNEDID